MDTKRLIEIMNTVEPLKCNTRHSWLSNGRQESVAEHSWRLAALAFFMQDEFENVNTDKIIKMCLFHDLGEAFTGDIPAFSKTEKHEKEEYNAVKTFLKTLPQPYQTQLAELFDEMNEQKTVESKIYKALDKMEVLIQHNEANISTWIECEYQNNLTYGEEEVKFSDYMKQLKQEIKNTSQNKIDAESNSK